MKRRLEDHFEMIWWFRTMLNRIYREDEWASGCGDEKIELASKELDDMYWQLK